MRVMLSSFWGGTDKLRLFVPFADNINRCIPDLLYCRVKSFFFRKVFISLSCIPLDRRNLVAASLRYEYRLGRIGIAHGKVRLAATILYEALLPIVRA